MSDEEHLGQMVDEAIMEGIPTVLWNHDMMGPEFLNIEEDHPVRDMVYEAYSEMMELAGKTAWVCEMIPDPEQREFVRETIAAHFVGWMVKHTLCEICDKLHEDFDESDVILSTDLNHHHEDWSEFLHAQLTLDHVVKILLADGDLMFPVETEFVWPDEE